MPRSVNHPLECQQCGNRMRVVFTVPCRIGDYQTRYRVMACKRHKPWEIEDSVELCGAAKNKKHSYGLIRLTSYIGRRRYGKFKQALWRATH